ncbi:MAG: DUF6391 domain-containing protein [Thermoanaerobacteraceae bacterium]|nr:DUF6391 domain-containing protein [Thermoanaerobacteraceae bacterium]
MYLLFLILFPVLIFVLLNLIILPFQFTVRSLVNVITVPKEIFRVAVNKRVRQNHALEHATINVIEEKYGTLFNLSGYALEDGFIIRGNAPTDMVYEAAAIGQRRLKRGERYLAIHKRCGTSLAITNLIASVLFLILLLKYGYFNLLNIVIAILAASMIGPFFGKYVQLYLTTAQDVENMEIINIIYRNQPMSFWNINNEYFVQTRRI